MADEINKPKWKNVDGQKCRQADNCGPVDYGGGGGGGGVLPAR